MAKRALAAPDDTAPELPDDCWHLILSQVAFKWSHLRISKRWTRLVEQSVGPAVMRHFSATYNKYAEQKVVTQWHPLAQAALLKQMRTTPHVIMICIYLFQRHWAGRVANLRCFAAIRRILGVTAPRPSDLAGGWRPKKMRNTYLLLREPDQPCDTLLAFAQFKAILRRVGADTEKSIIGTTCAVDCWHGGDHLRPYELIPALPFLRRPVKLVPKRKLLLDDRRSLLILNEKTLAANLDAEKATAVVLYTCKYKTAERLCDALNCLVTERAFVIDYCTAQAALST
jgi:hypothetical protein